jgi:uncharacterized membrane protein
MKYFLLIFIFCFFSFCLVAPIFAQQDMLVVPQGEPLPSSVVSTESAHVPQSFPKDAYYKARVLSIVKEGREEVEGYKTEYQVLQLKLLEGPETGKAIELSNRQLAGQNPLHKVRVGDDLVVVKSGLEGESVYVIADKYRLQPVIILLVVFFILVVLFGRWKGFFSIFGLAVSILIIVQFIIPRIVRGENPFWVTLTGILFIAVSSLYLAHGFTKRTSIALLSTTHSPISFFFAIVVTVWL